MNNKLQANILSSLAEYVLSGFLKKVQSDITLDSLHFNNDHLLNKNFFSCPACLNTHIKYCGSFMNKNSTYLTPIYYCEECGTIRTPQKHIYQTISRDTKEFAEMNLSLQQHLNFETRNRGLAQNLFNYLSKNTSISLTNIIEIGCGPGWLLDEARKLDILSVGFDLATDAIEYGKNKFSLDLRNEIFSTETSIPKFDLLICIMVLEHIQNPEDLVQAIAFHCKKNNSPALLSVPIVEDLNSLIDSCIDVSHQSSLFCYSPGHTCHYTQEGFAKLWKRYGATSILRLKIPHSWPFLFLIYF